MEERAGNTRQAQMVFQRSMAETMSKKSTDEEVITARGTTTPISNGEEPVLMMSAAASPKIKPSKKNKEIEVSRWNAESNDLDAEVWMNNGSIEGKVPAAMMNRLKNKNR